MKQNSQLPALAGFTRSTLAIAVAATFPVGASLAQEIKELPTAQASAQTEDSYKIIESTSYKYTQPLLDTAKTITVVPQSVMKDRNVDSLRDALRNVPGISLAAGEGGTPTGDSMYIRGFNARNDIMIDGVRDIAGYARDTYNVESVEVAKGPGSAVSGRGSTGGSINLQTKTATLDSFNDIGVRTGNASDYRAKIDSNIVLGEVTALRINLLADDGEVAGRDEVENSKKAIALSFATGLETDSRISFNADYQKQDNLPDYGLPWVPNYSDRDDRILAPAIAGQEGQAPSVDYSNFYGNVNRDFEDITAKSFTLKYEKDFSQSTMLRALVRSGSVARLSVVNAPRFTFTGSGTAIDPRVYGDGGRIDTGGEKTRDTKDSINVFQVDLIGNYEFGGMQHNLVTGVEIAAEKFERWNYVDVVADNLEDLDVDLNNPNSNLSFTGHYARTDKTQEATGDTTGIYVFDTLTVNPQWEVSMGLRYDIFESEYFYDLAGGDPSVKLEGDNKELSWSAGVVFKPAANGSIYFGAGNSFSPSAEDLTASTRGNNNDLDPEETVSFELGTKWELFEGRVFASAAIFRTDKTNARTDAPDGLFDPSIDDGRFDTLNGQQRVDGLELGAYGQITDQFSVSLGYTFQDSEVVKAGGDDVAQEGSELARTPKNSFSLWSRYEANDKVAIGFGTQYVGERYNSASPGGREQAEDYMIFDFMISYQLNEKLGLQFNGSNLTDEEYQDQLGGGHFVPGEGRSLSLTMNYSF